MPRCRRRALARGCITAHRRARRRRARHQHLQDTIVRSNLPDRTDSSASTLPEAEGLVGNRHMTVRVNARGSTYDVYFPTVGLHSYVRPREGDNPQAARISARSSADWRSASGWIGSPSARPGTLPAVPGCDQSPDDQAALATWADPGTPGRLRRHGGLPALERGPGAIARPVHQAILHHQRG